MTARVEFPIRARVWRWKAEAGWHFVRVDRKTSRTIRELFGNPHGWGAVPVTVQLGTNRWDTSIFPESNRGAYILPLKASVRNAEGVNENDVVSLTLTIRGV